MGDYNYKGFSFIELVVALSIFLIISSAGYGVLAIARKAWSSGDSQITVQQEAREGISRMIKELRQTSASQITGVPADGNYYSSITFRVPVSISGGTIIWSDQIQYFVGGLNNEQLIRQSVTNQTVLANKVSLLTFKRDIAALEVVEIELTTQKETFTGFSSRISSITLTSRAKIRN